MFEKLVEDINNRVRNILEITYAVAKIYLKNHFTLLSKLVNVRLETGNLGGDYYPSCIKGSLHFKFKQWDLGSHDYFFHTKGTLQFKQFSFKPKAKFEFNGGGNVMIHIEEKLRDQSRVNKLVR